MLPVIKSIAAGWAAIKFVETGQTAITTIMNMAASLGTLQGQIALIGGAAVAVGVYFADWLGNASSSVEDVAKAYKKEAEESAQALKDMESAARDSADATNLQYDKTQLLWNELQKLADSSGKVKKADQARAEYIINELQTATGVEIEMIDGQIQKYSDLASSIDNVIAKKRAESTLSAYEEKYQEASETADQYQQDYLTAQEKLNKLETLSGVELARFMNAEGDYGIALSSDLTKDDVSAQYNELKGALTEQAEEAKNNYLLATDYMARVEDAQEAMANGEYDQVDDILKYEQDANSQATTNLENSLEEREAAFESSIDSAYETLKLANESSSKSQQQAAATALQHLVEDYTAGGLNSGVNFSNEFKSQIQQAINDGVDFDAFIEAAGDAGWDIGELMGSAAAARYSEILSERMSQRTQELYANNNLIVASINSASDAALYRSGQYKLSKHATGGFIPTGAGIVAEAGPELIQIMNNGAKITPLTESARNQAIGESSGTQKIFYNTYSINIDKVASDYDVTKLAQKLADMQHRIERGKGH